MRAERCLGENKTSTSSELPRSVNPGTAGRGEAWLGGLVARGLVWPGFPATACGDACKWDLFSPKD